jgi:hypothetical protein
MLRFYAVNSIPQMEYSPETIVGSDRKRIKGKRRKPAS